MLFVGAAAAVRFGAARGLDGGFMRLEPAFNGARGLAGGAALPPLGALPETLGEPGGIRGARVFASAAHAQEVRHRGTAAGLAAARQQPGLGAHADPAADAEERRLGRVNLDSLAPDWLSCAAVAREGRAGAALRRAFDILGSLVLVLLMLPLLVLTAIAIRLESPGPAFYRQERVGRGGRVFTLFKFRSMRVDAEAGGPCWALPRDPRVTRVGRFIRLTRIDEIPQVFNVLAGDMALIGPRPERPAFVQQLAAVIPHYESRHAVRPGITGWAQVNYPYGASVEDARNKLAYDLFYLRRRTFALDVAIVIGTFRVVLLQEGAR
jgi:exopolysaccharide biosynthesis polyprenyl glycosylphosphotransferase